MKRFGKQDSFCRPLEILFKSLNRIRNNVSPIYFCFRCVGIIVGERIDWVKVTMDVKNKYLNYCERFFEIKKNYSNS